jgi:hypothetical protein
MADDTHEIRRQFGPQRSSSLRVAIIAEFPADKAEKSKHQNPNAMPFARCPACTDGLHFDGCRHIGSRDALSSRELFNYSSALGQSKST